MHGENLGTRFYLYAAGMRPGPGFLRLAAHSANPTRKSVCSAGMNGGHGRWYLLLKQENPHLAWNQCLADAACIRAKHLESTNSFSDRDPVSGKNPAFDMVKSNCSEFRVVGENFARGSDDPKELHRVLMESPSHRDNIMDPQYELVGVGCCEDYWL